MRTSGWKAALVVGAAALTLGCARLSEAQGGYFAPGTYGAFQANMPGSWAAPGMSYFDPYTYMSYFGSPNPYPMGGVPYYYTQVPAGGVYGQVPAQEAQVPVNPPPVGVDNLSGVVTGPGVVTDSRAALANALANAQGAELANPIPRTSEAIDARIMKDGRLRIQWQGEPQLVTSITFSLLDSQRRPLTVNVINRLPATATMKLTNKTAFYKVDVDYVNGAHTSVTSPL